MTLRDHATDLVFGPVVAVMLCRAMGVTWGEIWRGLVR